MWRKQVMLPVWSTLKRERIPQSVCPLYLQRVSYSGPAPRSLEQDNDLIKTFERLIKEKDKALERERKALEREKEIMNKVREIEQEIMKEKDKVREIEQEMMKKALEREQEIMKEEDKAREREQEMMKKALEREQEIMNELLREKDDKILKLEKKEADIQSRTAVVFNNRLLVEVGLSVKYPSLGNSTQRCEKFFNDVTLDSGNRFKDNAVGILRELGCTDNDFKPVLKELRDLYHELSKPFHYKTNDLSGTGYAVGGERPLGLAVGLVVVFLQREKALKEEKIWFLDEELKRIKTLEKGTVSPYSEKQKSE